MKHKWQLLICIYHGDRKAVLHRCTECKQLNLEVDESEYGITDSGNHISTKEPCKGASN